MRTFLTIFSLLLACILTSCNNEETYAEQKEKERDVISSFLGRDVCIVDANGDTLCHVGVISPISEQQFNDQGQTTDLTRNEYVLFGNSGVYMQIERKGVGEKLAQGKSARVACQFIEFNMLGDSIQLRSDVNYWASQPDILKVSNNSGTFSAYFDTEVNGGGAMYYQYKSTSVPSGWLVPFSYINIGQQKGPEGIAKVRLIVPHSQGTSAASNSVYPCFYQMTFQKIYE